MKENTIHIYGPTFSNFVRSVMIVCEEKEIPYTVGFDFEGQEVTFKGEQHLQLHPFGKIPVLIENRPQHETFTLPETASICRYLDCDNILQPKNELAHARHDALCAHISIDIDKVLLREYLMEFAFPKGEDNTVRFDVVANVKVKVATTLAIIEKIVNEESALSSEQFTIADALLVPMLHYISCLPVAYNVLPDYPALEQYLAKLMTRPSCQKVLIAKNL